MNISSFVDLFYKFFVKGEKKLLSMVRKSFSCKLKLLTSGLYR